MIRFYMQKKHKTNTRHKKAPKDSFKLFNFFYIRFYMHKKHKKNASHQKVPKSAKSTKT